MRNKSSKEILGRPGLILLPTSATFYINILVIFGRQDHAHTLHNSLKLTTVWLDEDYRIEGW